MLGASSQQPVPVRVHQLDPLRSARAQPPNNPDPSVPCRERAERCKRCSMCVHRHAVLPSRYCAACCSLQPPHRPPCCAALQTLITPPLLFGNGLPPHASMLDVARGRPSKSPIFPSALALFGCTPYPPCTRTFSLVPKPRPSHLPKSFQVPQVQTRVYTRPVSEASRARPPKTFSSRRRSRPPRPPVPINSHILGGGIQGWPARVQFGGGAGGGKARSTPAAPTTLSNPPVFTLGATTPAHTHTRNPWQSHLSLFAPLPLDSCNGARE